VTQPWFETECVDFTKVYLCPKAQHCGNNHVGGPQHNACHHAVEHEYEVGECCGDDDYCPGCEVVGSMVKVTGQKMKEYRPKVS